MRALLATVVLLAGAWAQPANAREDDAKAQTRVVVLPLSLNGDVPETRRADLATALREGLSRGEFEVTVPPQGTAACATPKCASEAARAADADYSVTMTVTVDRRDYAIVLDLVNAESGRSVARTEELCELCGIAEALEVVDSQAAALRDRLEAMLLEAPMLSFVSEPTGAVVRLDGKVVGETPFERTVQPGSHRAEADKSGYVQAAREFEVVAGVRSTVAFDLNPVPRSVRYRKLRGFGWAALGVGGASLVAGITLIAIDGKPNVVSCDGENVDPRGNCKFLYATLEAGIAVTVVGVALAGTGIGIAIGTRDRRANRAQARLSLGRSGLTVSGRF